MGKKWKQWQTFIILGSKITADGDYSHALVAQMVKHLPTMLETRVQSLGQEDLLEKEMKTHSSILAWKIPRMEEPGRLQSMGSQRVGYGWATSLSIASASSVSQISFSKSNVDEIPKYNLSVRISGQDFLSICASMKLKFLFTCP